METATMRIWSPAKIASEFRCCWIRTRRFDTLVSFPYYIQAIFRARVHHFREVMWYNRSTWLVDFASDSLRCAQKIARTGTLGEWFYTPIGENCNRCTGYTWWFSPIDAKVCHRLYATSKTRITCKFAFGFRKSHKSTAFWLNKDYKAVELTSF